MKKMTCHEISTILLLVAMLVMLVMTPGVSAGANLKLGDILVAEPGNSSVSVVDPVTGTKTIIASGGLLSPANKAVAVALAADGDVIVVHRENGLIRVNPVTGAQSVLSQGNHFRDPWTLAIEKETGLIYVADSGYDNDRPEINEAGKIIMVDPVSGAQEIIAAGSPCTLFPAGVACQNTTSAGSYLSHPYGIAIDYTPGPTLGTLVVTDMSSFNGQGAIIRIQPVPNGTQTLLWGPASAVPAPQVPQLSPLGCPMGVTIEPNGNLLTTTFTFPVPPVPTLPIPTGTYYGCAPPGIFRIDLVNNVQTVLNANAPAWQPNHAYAVGDVIRDEISSTSYVHRVVTAGVSQNSAPDWNEISTGTTPDGTVVWQNIGRGGSWLIPFGIDTEPMPTPSNPSQYNIIVGDEGYSMLFRLDAQGVPTPSDEPLASDISNVSSLDVLTFTPPGGFKIEPLRSNGQSNGQSAGVLPAGTTQATLSLTTGDNATCRYSTQAGVAYSAMPNTFTTTGSTQHSTTVTGLTNGGSYTFYVRCMDSAGRVNTDDFTITFSVALPPSVEPVAAYGFSSGSGTVLTDGSGHGNTGVVSGATWTTQGKFGNALLFDGVNDWVTVAHAPALNLTTGMTLEAWVYPTANGGGSWRNVLIKERTNGEVYNLYANADTNTPVVYVVEAQGGVALDAQGAAQLPLNTWTHLAATYDGTTLRLYVNGNEVGNRVITGALLTSTGVLRIGGNSIWGEFFQGRIDEVRIYNRPLTPTEIQTDMATSVDGSLPDTTPPGRFNGQPTGVLTSDTTQTTLSLTTDENATCRYSPQAGVAYSAMPSTFVTTGATTHTTPLNGLTSGTSYTFYVRCVDGQNNANPDDFVLAFSVARASATISNFVGVENPLSESGVWEAAGTWTDLQKIQGAYTTGLNAQARLVLPPTAADQFVEITFDQDPGAASWVGAMTRVQGTANGSGYLAIAYAGDVRLYRAEDTGALNFTLLAAASVNLSVAPRRLRLESAGNTHTVYFNGTQVLSHQATGTLYTSGQPGIAASVFGGPQVKILSFEGGNLSAGSSDTTPPGRFNGQPTGVLTSDTTQTTLSLTTDEAATCKYSPTAGVAYSAMLNSFTTTGSTAHTTVVSGLTSGTSYMFYVRCVDTSSNANPDDFVLAFSVARASATISNFVGVENPLSENGVWETPGMWTDLQKNQGAYTTGLNAQALLLPPTAADQFVEITFDQDPGAASWVGVMTRVQGTANGSGYLAIAYAGDVRLYRAEDTGVLNFTLLAAASADLSVAPRRLRLESAGNTHTVYFNGTQVLSHQATGTLYTSGQPGIAASVFGGPQVKILSFEGGDLGD